MRSFFSFLLFLFFPISLFADSTLSVEESRQLASLAQSKAWLRLGYYVKSGSSYESRVAAKEFFLSKQGAENPEAELLASYEAFKSNQVIRDSQTAQCLFPARYSWLKNILKPDIEFIDQDCKRFKQWSDLLAAEHATLIFPTSYQNNPASMFGHTLLRLDQANQTEHTRMLSYSVNYAAETQGEGALLYAAKGVFGGYNGYFSISPYYKMLRRYSDLESRDIWEYQLNLSQADLNFLVMHLWELKGVPFRYFYFDENCSYQLLALLEAVRPDLELTKRFKIHVIPVDTVRSVLDQQDILKATYFRPSFGTRIKNRVAELPETNLSATKNYIEGDTTALSDLSETDRAIALDLAYDLLEFKRLKNSGDTSKTEKRLLSILKDRSKLNVQVSTNPSVYKPDDISPHEGHKTTRSRLSPRYEFKQSMLDFEIRPAYHDSLDFSAGYTEGFGIDFLEPGFRLREHGGIQLKKLQVLAIESIAPRGFFFKPFSWSFSTGLERRYFIREDDSLQYQSSLSVGGSWQSDIGLISVLPELSLPFSSHYDDVVDAQPGLGLSLLTDRGTVAIQPMARAHTTLLYSSDVVFEINMPLRIALDTNSAIRLNYARTWEADFNYNSFGVSYDYFW